MIPASEALKRLQEGNARFASGVRSLEAMMSQTRRADLVAGQEPFAIILGCSDSRVPAELVFDQGLGDLFIVRVAGNIVAPSQVGSVATVQRPRWTHARRLQLALSLLRDSRLDALLNSEGQFQHLPTDMPRLAQADSGVIMHRVIYD
jgi:hypothetical protein